MASPPQPSAPTISPAEIQILVSRAGLVLNPGQVADLVLAWRQVAGLIGAMPRERKLADDMALVFRLPPPAGLPSRPGSSPRAKTAATTPAAKTADKPKAADNPKASKPKAAQRMAPAPVPTRKAEPKTTAKAKRR